MITKYLVIHPLTKNVNPHTDVKSARDEATILSREYGVGVEIKREPKPYKAKEMILSI